jgi:hypothetical protein
MTLKQVKELVRFARENGIIEIKLGDFSATMLPTPRKPVKSQPFTAEQLIKEAQAEADELLYRSAGTG